MSIDGDSYPMQAWLPGYAGFLTQDLRRCVENRSQVPGQVFERNAPLQLGQEKKIFPGF